MAKFPSYSLLSPRKSFSRGDCTEEKSPDFCKEKPKKSKDNADQEDGTKEMGDFEFHLVDNFTMLPADELFYHGKLMPLQVSMVKMTEALSEPPSSRIKSPQKAKPLSRNEVSTMDPYLFSPKAPRCTSNWKEFLGLRKVYQKENENNSRKSNSFAIAKSLKRLSHRSSKSSMSLSFDGSINLPLMTDHNESNSRSSSSSSHDHDDLPRLSQEVDNKFTSITLPRVSVPYKQRIPRVTNPRKSTSTLENPKSGVRVTRSITNRQPGHPNPALRLVSMDSPRMNASGKIVYNTLERSTSSPSSYGGPRYKHSSVQRSYSANIRVTPVLNVPVCSVRGSFGLFASSSTQPRRDSFGSINGSNSSKGSHLHNQSCNKHRKDRNNVGK